MREYLLPVRVVDGVNLKYEDTLFYSKGLYATINYNENEPSPVPVTVDKGVALITKQKDCDNGNELYMFENLGNVRDELFDGIPPMQMRVSLPEGTKKFYFRGEEIQATPNEQGEYSFDLKVGDAIFVELIK